MQKEKWKQNLSNELMQQKDDWEKNLRVAFDQHLFIIKYYGLFGIAWLKLWNVN